MGQYSLNINYPYQFQHDKIIGYIIIIIILIGTKEMMINMNISIAECIFYHNIEQMHRKVQQRKIFQGGESTIHHK